MSLSHEFQIATLSPGLLQPSIATATHQSGELGVLDFEYVRDQRAITTAMERLQRAVRACFGIKLNGDIQGFLAQLIPDLPDCIKTVILTSICPQELRQHVRLLREKQIVALLEATCLEHAQRGEAVGFDGIVAKGHEAGGRIAGETTFILLQRFQAQLGVPVWAHGGIGLHTAPACAAAGAAGIILDSQLMLTRESPYNDTVKARIASMDGSETICVGEQLGESYRILFRPGDRLVNELQELEARLVLDEREPREILADWRQAIFQRVGWECGQNVLLLGQDASFAAPLAKRFRTVGGVLHAMREAIRSHCQAAARLRPLAEDSSLARSHGTRYPILQGPMTRVSDVPEFAGRVAEAGALPFLALALMRGPEVRTLLAEAQSRMGTMPWGVGILGFVPPELRQEQLEIIQEYRPPFALIAGGRPDQAAGLEQKGISTYLHVPSPGLLQMFVQQGARRFVFEGRECGGHVGPRTSFVLWNQMVDVLLGAPELEMKPQDFHVVFAAGIHDALSAAMVSVIAAPLAEKGVRVGVLLGTAYLFTEEVVSSGAIQRTFQEQAQQCRHTVLLETGPGHASRCIDTPYSVSFAREKRRLSTSGVPAEEMRTALENLNLGRLRIASKGVTRHPDFGQSPTAPKLLPIDKNEQVAQGMYMIGQVAALRDTVCTIQELHYSVSVESSNKLEGLADRSLDASSSRHVASSDVAIIGMACLLPQAPDLRTYWENIIHKVDAIREIPKERWDWTSYFDSDPKAKDKIYSKWGGFLEDTPFDPIQYGMPPASLRSIEPAQLLTLQVVGAALEDAGYVDRPFARERTSVILGAGGGAADLGLGYGARAFVPVLENLPEFRGRSREILDHLSDQLPEWTEDSFAGILTNVSAGRVANRFDLGGSNYTVDAACASSLAAVSIALKELEGKTSDMVIVGGVDTMQNPFTYLCFSKTHALSPRGRCRPFDESADGIVISEGIAIMVFKRLEDAERDGDRIYAVIKSAGSSSDGKDRGLTAPRPEGQARALKRAYDKAGISPATVGLIEAHGTGTVAGDGAEVQALTQVFSEAQARQQGCAIGSVKSMIGHTKCTAGAAGLMKAALALHHKVLPPTLGVQKPNPRARFAETPFFVNTEPRPWLDGWTGHPRRAGVSAFGFGGTNFHVVLEEHTGDPVGAQPAICRNWSEELFVWRGDTRQALLNAVQVWEKALTADVKPALRDLAYTAWKQAEDKTARAGRPRLQLAIVASSLDDLRQKLGSAKDSLAQPATVRINDPRGIYFSEQLLASQGKLAFLFPGQGSQCPWMLQDLLLHFPEMREIFEEAVSVLQEKLDQPLTAYVFPPPAFSREEEKTRQQALTRTNIAQPALGAADLAMFRLLQEFGLQPEMVAGHSYGEYVALAAAGVFSAETLISLSEARGRFILEAAGTEPGIMAAVEAGADAVADALRDFEGVCLANANGPRQSVISGQRAAVERAVEHFAAHGMTASIIPVACAFHSPVVARAQAHLAEFLSTVDVAEPSIPVYSNTTAAPYPTNPDAVKQRLAEHLVRPVEFVREVESMYDGGARVFVEVGPRSVLTSLVDQILQDRPKLAVASNQSGRPDLLQILHLLGQLAAQGYALKLDRLYRDRSARCLDLGALQRECSEKPLPSSVWMVNGARATPLNQCSTQSAPKQAKKGRAPTPQNVPAESLASRVHPPATAAPAAESVPTAPIPATTLALDGAPQVMAQFQQMMTRFLDMQKTVMLAYLSTESGAPALASSLTAPAREAKLPGDGQVTHQAAKLEPLIPAQPVPPSNGDSAVAAPTVAAAASFPAQEPSLPPSGPSKEEITAVLLSIVSERTGYPQEMLSLNLNLEADLGIDSIKRVEILGTLQQSFASAGVGLEEGLMEKLSGVRTLQAIIDRVFDHIGGTLASEHSGKPVVGTVSPRAAPKPVTPSPRKEAGEEEQIGRYTLTAVETPLNEELKGIETPLNGELKGIARDRAILITDGGHAVAQALVRELLLSGYKVATVRPGHDVQELDTGSYAANLSSPDSVAELIELVRQRQGPLGSIVHLLPLHGEASFAAHDYQGWKEQLRYGVKSLFLLAKAAGEDVRKAAAESGACLIAATGMGGAFLSDLPGHAVASFPDHGAIAGLMKTLAVEWPEVCVKVVDFNLEEDGNTLARHLLEELHAGDGLVEVGYNGRRRVTVKPIPAPLCLQTPATPALDSSDVVLITGGARGITALAAIRLAELYLPTLVLAGRSPMPPPDEAKETLGINTPKELKAALMDQKRTRGEMVTPALLERAYARLTAEREIRGNLAFLQQMGARVHYYPVDVRDADAFGAFIDGIYSSFGRLDAVIHGAGVIEDKLIQDKSPESFDRVFDTKVDSAFVLSRKLRQESLKFLLFFSSVAGRFGNRGQGDYAAANEVLNKLAVCLDRTWTGRVVAIDWGPWDSQGMVSDEVRKQFAERGVKLISPSAGLRRLEEEINYGQRGEAEIVIGGVDWPVTRQRIAAHDLWPLLGHAVISRSETGLEFVRELDPAYDVYLNDHQLDGQPVLPLAIATELMAEAVAQGWPEMQVVGVRALRVLHGIVLESGTKTVRIEVKPEDGSTSDSARFAVEVSGAGHPRRVHYRATIELARRLPEAPSLELVPLADGRPFSMEIAELYRQWLFHGPLFQGISRADVIGVSGITASLATSTPNGWIAGGSQRQWLIDPLMFDSALQLLVVWAREHWDMTALPSGFQRFRRFAAPTAQRILCELRLRPETGAQTIHADVFFINAATGAVVGILEDMQGACSKELNRLAGRELAVTAGTES